MALNSKYISFKRIIENVHRDYDLLYDNWYDIVEWIASAVHLIGVSKAFTERITDGSDASKITVANYRGKLPSDLVAVIMVRDYDTKIPLRESTNKFLKAAHTDSSGSTYITTSTTENTIETGTKNFYVDTGLGYTASQVAKVEYDSSNYMYGTVLNYDTTTGTLSLDIIFTYGSGTYSSWDITLRDDTKSYSYEKSYQLKEDYIYTSEKDMTLEMIYRAFPTDDDGYPAIPDEENYINAVVAFVAWKIAFKMWVKGSLRREVYEEMARQKAFRIRKAQVASNMPSIDKMESIKNQWLKLIPDISSHRTGFASRGYMEQLG